MESLDIISLRNRRNTERVVRNSISDVLGINLDTLDKSTSLYEELSIDDLDLIEIIMLLEMKLNIIFIDEEIDKFTTVGDIYKYVQEKMINVNEPKL